MRRVLMMAGSTVSLLLAGALGGCYEDVDGAPPPPRARAEQEPAVEAEPAAARSDDMPRASGSTLGQAKNSAKRTVGELEKEIDDQ